MSKGTVHVLDYGAGNVRSLRNAISALGYECVDVGSPAELASVESLIFPGVGSFGFCMAQLRERGYVEALKAYLAADKPFLGICLGLQTLFEASEESPGVAGLGVIRGTVQRFTDPSVAVPHMGWNTLRAAPAHEGSALLDGVAGSEVYFVHSFRALASDGNAEWVQTYSDHGDSAFISSLRKGRVMATQFHPEKSGAAGLRMLGNFLAAAQGTLPWPAAAAVDVDAPAAVVRTVLAKRVIACLDVRSNDAGDLVVTKGDQYDVREAAPAENVAPAKGGTGRRGSVDGSGEVRNLGKPVELAARYYAEGADEVTFLNITSFRESPLEDLPLKAVLEAASVNVFVPLCIGGGIRNYVDSAGAKHSALDVAAEYFRSGADKVSIGSDAVVAAQAWYESDGGLTGSTAIETISYTYGAQAVVISVDPRRVYTATADALPAQGKLPAPVVIALPEGEEGPAGEKFAWYAATVRGGRETTALDAVGLARACEALGAGEILLNCINKDGTNSGFDCGLVRAVKQAVGIPVIASSGAGKPEHFSEVFAATDVEAALAAGIFHRREVPIWAVKQHLQDSKFPIRRSE